MWSSREWFYWRDVGEEGCVGEGVEWRALISGMGGWRVVWGWCVSGEGRGWVGSGGGVVWVWYRFGSHSGT